MYKSHSYPFVCCILSYSWDTSQHINAMMTRSASPQNSTTECSTNSALTTPAGYYTDSLETSSPCHENVP